MFKYYVAEGVMSQHAVLIASADPSPDKLLKVKHCIGRNMRLEENASAAFYPG